MDSFLNFPKRPLGTLPTRINFYSARQKIELQQGATAVDDNAADRNLNKSNTPQQADGACFKLVFRKFAPRGLDLHPKGTYPRGCLHSVSVHASHAPLAHSTVKYPWKHGYFPKCPLGTLLTKIKTWISIHLSNIITLTGKIDQMFFKLL